MAKRLSRQEKEQQMVVDMINEMFQIAGHDITYNDVKDRKDNWFQQWTMTMAQYDQWKEWGKRYLMKKFRFPARYAERQMGMIGLMWGLKFSDFLTNKTEDEQVKPN
jgi:hypothetical protein